MSWIQHVKQFQKENNISYKEALSRAAETYTKMEPKIREPKPRSESSGPLSSWMSHVKQYASDNNVSYKTAMSEAKSTYKKNEVIGKGFSKFGEGIQASTFQKMLK